MTRVRPSRHNKEDLADTRQPAHAWLYGHKKEETIHMFSSNMDIRTGNYNVLCQLSSDAGL